MEASLRPSKVIRVLVVDDSVVARRVVARAFEGDESLELVGVAANGQIALEKLTRLNPDVVVLDLEMPVMDGFETLRAIRSTHPGLPVIVFSHLTAKGAAATLDAMALGAAGHVAKPSAEATALDGNHVRHELVPLIKALADHASQQVPSATAASGPTIATSPSIAVNASGPILDRRASALVVAASTGGPSALAAVVGALPADLAVPVLVVQHMPAVFTKQLAERLNRIGPLSVVEAAARQPVAPGRVYIAPGGRHMGVERVGTAVCIALHEGPPENSCRPAADVLFRSAVGVYGDRLLGVVLTGMGHDGLRGAELIRAAGGTVIAQDQATAVVGSMPGAVADAGLADAVVPLERIGPELWSRLERTGMS